MESYFKSRRTRLKQEKIEGRADKLLQSLPLETRSSFDEIFMEESWKKKKRMSF
jgi:hypothetical protein